MNTNVIPLHLSLPEHLRLSWLDEWKRITNKSDPGVVVSLARDIADACGARFTLSWDSHAKVWLAEFVKIPITADETWFSHDLHANLILAIKHAALQIVRGSSEIPPEAA